MPLSQTAHGTDMTMSEGILLATGTWKQLSPMAEGVIRELSQSFPRGNCEGVGREPDFFSEFLLFHVLPKSAYSWICFDYDAIRRPSPEPSRLAACTLSLKHVADFYKVSGLRYGKRKQTIQSLLVVGHLPLV